MVVQKSENLVRSVVECPSSEFRQVEDLVLSEVPREITPNLFYFNFFSH